MKLSAREAAGYLAKPDPKRAGLLIFGADAMRVALKRQEAIAALIGPDGDKEMRLTRIPAGDLRTDPAQLIDAIKAQGFFPGARVALVEDATQWSGDALTAALAEWRDGDAQIVVTAGNLKPTSPIRKLFEKHLNAVAIAIYDNPPTPAEIETELAKSGLPAPAADGKAALFALAEQLDPGDFRQLLEKIALYKLDDPVPLSGADVAACGPASIEAAVDDLLSVVAEGRAQAIGPLMTRLQSQGVNAVTLIIGLARHFRLMHGAAANPGARIFHPRANDITRQARGWGVQRLETALKMITDTDLTLRSTSRAPAMALVERTMIRLAMLGNR